MFTDVDYVKLQKMLPAFVQVVYNPSFTRNCLDFFTFQRAK